MPTLPPRGVRKVSELITQEGRTLILSEEDASKLSWADIPVSTLKVNPKTGITYVKIEGESSWVPFGVKNDGTLSIARDACIVEETFVVKKIDLAAKEFEYTNSEDQTRRSNIKDDMFVFELENGTYMMHRNHIEVFIDDTLRRCESSANLVEQGAGKFFSLHKSDIRVGTEVTAKYYKALRVGNPYPRIFIGDNTPVDAEIGDLYIDTDYDLSEWKKYRDDDGRLNWSIIKNTPNSLEGYGIKDVYSKNGHRHSFSDLYNVPQSFPANGGNSETANRLRNPRKIRISGDLSGEGSFDGSSDATINVNVNRDSLKRSIVDITGTDDVLGYIKRATNRISVLSGSMSAPSGMITLPIPSGYGRHECRFSAFVHGNLTPDSVRIDFVNGTVTTNANTLIFYITIGIKNGGVS